MTEAKPVRETRLHMAQLMTPNDANYLGNVFGGSILSLIDLTASATASKFSGHTCVTASFDRVDFLAPVEIGEMVELDGHIAFVGRTSMEVTIDVHATNLRSGARKKVNTARVTMVAVENGKPAPVPRLQCETRDEKLQFLEGRLRREIRTDRIQEMAEMQGRIEAADDELLDRVLASTDPVRSFFP